MTTDTTQTLDLTRDTRRLAAGDLLPQDLRMDNVTLAVGDLAGMVVYYRDALGLVEMTDPRHHVGSVPNTVILGRGTTPLVALEHRVGHPVPSRRAAGLFHTAILFPTQAELAATVLRAAQHPQSQFAGSSDHLVSEAFYFTDPEGNGIELYWDRPRKDCGRCVMLGIRVCSAKGWSPGKSSCSQASVSNTCWA